MKKPELEKVLYLATLIFPVRGNHVLLGKKLRKIGAGKLNGWGGGVENGETIKQCAVREFGVETGGAIICEEDLTKVGIAHFKNHTTDGMDFECTVHIYTVSQWQGKIVQTEEMGKPYWYPISKLAEQKDIMCADPYWMPKILSGEKGIIFAEYGPGQRTLIGEVLFQSVESFEEE